MDEPQLPTQFKELETFLEWALATERERSAKRHRSTMTEIRAFYDAILSRLDEILKVLAGYPADGAPSAVQRLFLMTLSLAEIAPAVENFGQVDVVDGYDYARFVPTDGQ
jgi:hypothetical protein